MDLNKCSSVKKDSASKKNIIRNAAQRAVYAALNLGITITRSNLKKRLHRTPTDQKVSAYFQSWVTHSNFIEFASEQMLACMRDIESQLGKPSRNWSHDELLQAYGYVETYFYVLAESYERPRGRPRKRKNRGIINNAITEQNSTSVFTNTRKRTCILSLTSIHNSRTERPLRVVSSRSLLTSEGPLSVLSRPSPTSALQRKRTFS